MSDPTPQPTPPAPADPTPTDPPTPPTDPTPPAPPADPAAAPTPPWGTPEEFDPEKAWTLIQNAKAAEKAANAKTAKAVADAEKKTRDDLAKEWGVKLGLVPDDTADPAALLAQAQQERDNQTATARANALQLAVYRSSADHGADPDRLLDSRQFLAATAELDPASSDYAAQVAAAAKAASEKNPALRVAQVAPHAGEGTPPSGDPDPSTGEKSIEEHREAFRNRNRQR